MPPGALSFRPTRRNLVATIVALSRRFLGYARNDNGSDRQGCGGNSWKQPAVFNSCKLCLQFIARAATTFCALFARAHYYIIVKLKNFKNCRKLPKINWQAPFLMVISNTHTEKGCNFFVRSFPKWRHQQELKLRLNAQNASAEITTAIRISATTPTGWPSPNTAPSAKSTPNTRKQSKFRFPVSAGLARNKPVMPLRHLRSNYGKQKRS